MQKRESNFDKYKGLKRPKAKNPNLQTLIDKFDLVLEKKGTYK